MDSFIKHKRGGIPFKIDYTQKIDDLYEAYTFAQHQKLTRENIAEAHRLLSRNILGKSARGTLRSNNMYVSTPDGRIEYVAASPFQVPEEMEKLYHDIEQLLTANLSIEETFFYAAMIHLVFVKIHPWNDGNGRSARLIEKWFLAEKRGNKAWFLPSEKQYHEQHQLYYTNIRKLGLECADLDYSQATPFLLMLPSSFN